MPLIQDWLPPSRANWSLMVELFAWFPTITLFQWAIPWYSMGKTSQASRLNIRGKIGWIIMEVPGPLLMVYTMLTLPASLGLDGLPWENWFLASLFVIHYLYRALLSPLLNPSMSPIHPLIIAAGWSFQFLNALSLAGFLGGHAHTTPSSWHATPLSSPRMALGFALWATGFAGTIWHDDALREVRRAARRRASAGPKTAAGGKEKLGVEKLYVVPEAGLFRWVLCPHYLCEWVEWAGFWVMCGAGCVPARSFVVNEVASMLPRALQVRRWYVARFGEAKVAGRKAVLPGLL